MKPERWQQLDQLFHSALELPPVEREAFLDAACVDDPSLRREVEALLSAHYEAGSFIEGPALEVAARSLGGYQSELAVGQTIGHYNVISSIGAGGMGEVYLAQDLLLGRKVALKLLPAQFTRDTDRVRRFQQEARAASALNHPNIITIHEIGQAENRHFITTEFIDGETLRAHIHGSQPGVSSAGDHIAEKGIRQTEALSIAMQVADALTAAHGKGIVHRDIKPDNIILVRESYQLQKESFVKLLDFGIAKLTEQSGEDRDATTRMLLNTHEGSVIGTVSYMSPEQARGERVDSRTDIWSLGVVLHEMLNGKRPFVGGTSQDVMAAILRDELPPLPAESSETLKWIVKKALRKDREDRYQTAREMFSDLRDLHDAEVTVGVGVTQLAPVTARQGSQLTFEDSDIPTGEIIAHKTSSDLVSQVKRHKLGTILVLSALVILLTSVVFGLKYLRRNQAPKATTGTFTKIKMTRVTTGGGASDAAISPDGKYVAHVMTKGSKSSLWLRHIATGSDQEIVPASEARLGQLTFSPDGNRIYFAKVDSGVLTLFQIPVLGGPARGLVKDIDSPVTFSPDGNRFAFLRGDPIRREASLILASADGTGEQKLVTRNIADFLLIGSLPKRLAWSPDGETIAFALKDSTARVPVANVMEVRVRDGKEKQITFQSWSLVGAISWLPDGKGLIFIATEGERESNKQIWHGSYPEGKVRRITNDLNNYEDVSLTSDASTLVTVLAEQLSNVWVTPQGNGESPLQLTFDRYDGKSSRLPGGIVWTPDGRIVYVSRASGNSDIWIMNADGSANRQLTFQANWNGEPSVSSDGRYVVFASDRSGDQNIWRIDIDGGNPTQLTHGKYDKFPLCAPDNQSVIYMFSDGESAQVFKVPIAGGTAVPLTDYHSVLLSVSSKDGQIACTYVDERETPTRLRIGIIPSQGGPPIKTLDFTAPNNREISWTPDGSALAYIDTRAGISNLWKQRLDGSPPEQLTNFQSDRIFSYAWSRDGKLLAFARGMNTNDVVLINNLGDQE